MLSIRCSRIGRRAFTFSNLAAGLFASLMYRQRELHGSWASAVAVLKSLPEQCSAIARLHEKTARRWKALPVSVVVCLWHWFLCSLFTGCRHLRRKSTFGRVPNPVLCSHFCLTQIDALFQSCCRLLKFRLWERARIWQGQVRTQNRCCCFLFVIMHNMCCPFEQVSRSKAV